MNPYAVLQRSSLLVNARRFGAGACRRASAASYLVALMVGAGCSSDTNVQASNAAATGSTSTDGATSVTTPAPPSVPAQTVSPGGTTPPAPATASQTSGTPTTSPVQTSTTPAPTTTPEPEPTSGGVSEDSNDGATSSAGETSTSSVVSNGGDVSSSDVSVGPGTSEDATIVPDPGWACGMPDGIPSPTLGKLAFTLTFEVSGEHDVGNTPYGHRRLLDVSGGTIAGERLQGSVLTGGLEYELTLSNGVVEYQGINVLNASDGSRIFVRSCGVAADEDSPARIIPDFEATTSGSYAFLNTGKWVATREVSNGTMKLDVYDVAGVTAGEPRVTLHKPDGVPPQPWECNTTRGNRGAEVLTENVTLGSSFSIANAKYGSRNIIPITGGTTTGRVKGKILNGGADYQLSGSLDAWYTLAPDNGEFILVRNCGPSGALIPWFEAAVDGDFNFLNSNAYLSSDPGVGGGGVSITFYERQ